MHERGAVSVQNIRILDLFFQVEVESGFFDRKAIRRRFLLIIWLLFLHELPNAYLFGLHQPQEVFADVVVVYNPIVRIWGARLTFIDRVENLVVCALNNLRHMRVYFLNLPPTVWLDLRHDFENEL